MKTIFSLFLTLTVLSFTNLSAQAQSKNKNSYNISRALECFRADDYDSAQEFLNKELEDNPKSAIAYDMLGYIFLHNETYGKALTSFTTARKLYPKKDKEGQGRCCYYLARTYLCLEDTTAAIASYEEALTYQPDETDYMEELADAYFHTMQYQAAEKIYQKMHQNDPGNTLPFYGLVRNAYKQQQYDKAKEYVAKAKLLDGNSAMPHTLLMRIHYLEKDYTSMLKEAFNVLSFDISNQEAYRNIFVASDSIYQDVVNALTKKSFVNADNQDLWEFTLGTLYFYHKDYKKAIQTLQPLVDKNTDMKSWVCQQIIDAYDAMGNSSKVIALCNQLLSEDTENAKYTIKRGVAKFNMGMLDEARLDFETGMKLDLDYGYYCCYRLGWIAETKGNIEDALELYGKSIALNEEYAYTYIMKGNLLQDYLNRPEEAKTYFQKCIELEKGSIDKGICRQYAYIGLGNREKAIEVTDSLIAAFPDNPGIYYDAACVYCRLGDKAKGLHYLEICLEKGYRNIPHIMQDDDVAPIRGTDEFKRLIEKYSKLYEDEEQATPAAPTSASHLSKVSSC